MGIAAMGLAAMIEMSRDLGSTGDDDGPESPDAGAAFREESGRVSMFQLVMA